MRSLLLGAALLSFAASGAVAQSAGKGPEKNSDHVDHSAHAAAQPKANDKTAKGGDKTEGSAAPAAQGGNSDKDPHAAHRQHRSEPVGEHPRDNPPSASDRAERRGTRAEGRNEDRPALPAANRGRDAFRVAGGKDADRARSRERVGDWNWTFLQRDHDRGMVNGCPPGLARKYNGCLPPGQLRDHERDLFGYAYAPGLFGLRHYGAGRYYYDDGYLFQLDGDRIGGYIPLLGGALAVGNSWPSGYQSYNVPLYYEDYYNLGGRDRYRFADNVIYRIDPQDSAITSIAALLTGDRFEVGQPMPPGYDIYNVPYAYQERYYDTPDNWYRYSDGYVYQIDPETQLIAAAIDLLI